MRYGRRFFCDRGNPDVRKVTQGLEVAGRAFGGRCRIPGRSTVLRAAGAGYQRCSGKNRDENVAIKRLNVAPTGFIAAVIRERASYRSRTSFTVRATETRRIPRIAFAVVLRGYGISADRS